MTVREQTAHVGQAALEWTEVAYRAYHKSSQTVPCVIENAFKAGAEWQREQGSGDAVMRMLGSIENRLMEMKPARFESMLAEFQNVRDCVFDVGQKVEAVRDTLMGHHNPVDWPAVDDLIWQRDADMSGWAAHQAANIRRKRIAEPGTMDGIAGYHFVGSVEPAIDTRGMESQPGAQERALVDDDVVRLDDSAWPHVSSITMADGRHAKYYFDFDAGKLAMRTEMPKADAIKMLFDTLQAGWLPAIEPVRLGSEGKGGPVYTSTSENKSKWYREPTKDNRKEYVGGSPPHGTVVGGFRFGEYLNIGSEKLRPSKVLREPVTDESGISVGAGAGPLIKDTQPADQHAAFISAIEAIKAGERFSIYRSAGLSEDEFNFLHKRLVYQGWTILENIADMKWEMVPPVRAAWRAT